MSQKLKVSFDDPEHGWVGLSLNYAQEAITIIASCILSDSFLDLTNVLHSLLFYQGETTVVWHEEPAETELRFSNLEGLVRLEVYFFPDHRRNDKREEKGLAISGSYEEICIPFWRALRSLQGRFSAEELDARWQRPFPWKEIDVLTSAITEKLSQAAR